MVEVGFGGEPEEVVFTSLGRAQGFAILKYIIVRLQESLFRASERSGWSLLERKTCPFAARRVRSRC